MLASIDGRLLPQRAPRALHGCAPASERARPLGLLFPVLKHGQSKSGKGYKGLQGQKGKHGKGRGPGDPDDDGGDPGGDPDGFLSAFSDFSSAD